MPDPPLEARTLILVLAALALNLNSEVEDLRFRAQQCGAGFPACRFAGLSSPASGRLESRSNWQTKMSAPRDWTFVKRQEADSSL